MNRPQPGSGGPPDDSGADRSISPEEEATARRAQRLLRWVVVALILLNLGIVLAMMLFAPAETPPAPAPD